MDNIKTKLLNNTKDINNNLGVGLEYLFSFSQIIFICMLYNFIIAIFALHFVNEYSDNTCQGLNFISVNQYLFRYGVFTFVLVGLLLLSLVVSIISIFLNITILPLIVLLISIIGFICYVLFLSIWFIIGMIVMIYTSHCYNNILPQWTLIFMLIFCLYHLTPKIKLPEKKTESN